MRRPLCLLILVALLAGCGRGGGFVPAPGFGAAEISVSEGARTVSLLVEVAADSPARQQGLMFRQELPDGRGMLFVYPRPTGGGHWMKNTYIPLDIAYADEEGTVFEIVQGRPLDTTVLIAGAPYRFVLEVPAGWFQRQGLGPGSRLILPANLAPPQ